jgi:hypothetical protein
MNFSHFAEKWVANHECGGSQSQQNLNNPYSHDFVHRRIALCILKTFSIYSVASL